MYDDATKASCGVLFGVLGMTAADLVGTLSAIAACINACVLLFTLAMRAFITIKNRVKGKTTDDQFTEEITNIIEDVEHVSRETKTEEKQDGFAE